MKNKLQIVAVTLSLLFAVAFLTTASSCRPHGTAGASYDQSGTATVNAGLDVTSNVNVGVTGQYTPGTGAWSAGFTLTFKAAVPKYEADQLAALGGVPARDGVTYVFANVRNPADPRFQKAVTLAGGSGVAFTVTPLK